MPFGPESSETRGGPLFQSVFIRPRGRWPRLLRFRKQIPDALCAAGCASRVIPLRAGPVVMPSHIVGRHAHQAVATGYHSLGSAWLGLCARAFQHRVGHVLESMELFVRLFGSPGFRTIKLVEGHINILLDFFQLIRRL
jgi:hypothetical protein